MALPTDITGLYAWYRASSFSLADGDTCGNWTDSSGNGRTMVAGGVPKFYVNQIAGYPAVLLGGPNLGNFAHSTFGWLANLAQHTIFLVYKALNSGVYTGSVVGSVGGNSAEGVRVVSGQAIMQWASTTTTYQAIQALADGNWFYGAGGKGGAGVLDVRLNGAPKTSTVWSGTRRAGVDAYGLLGTDGGAYCYGYLAEAFITAGYLSDSDFAVGLDYLRSKYFDAVPSQNERIRDILSRRLWLLRRPQGILEITVPLRMLDADILDRVVIEHQLGPDPSGAGWRGKKWQRHAFSIQRLDVNPGAMTVRLRLLDRRPLDVLLWDTARTDVPALGLDTTRRSGVAQIMKGNAILFVRAQRAWVVNPGDPSSVIEIASNAHAYSSAGEFLEEQRTNAITRSSFVDGTAGLTLAGTGTNGSAIATDPDERLFNPEVLAPSLKFTAGNPHAADLRATFPTASLPSGGTKCALSIDHKTDSDGALSWRLRREDDGYYYNAATPAWQAGAVDNPLSAVPDRAPESRFVSLIDTAVSPIDPSGVSGLTGWWKADAGAYKDAGVTLATDGETVQQWNDQSGAGRNLAQGTSGARPTLVANVLNGKPVIRFDGTDDVLQSSAALSSFITAAAGTFFVVGILRANNTDNATEYENDAAFQDVSGNVYLSFRTSNPRTRSVNFDGSADVAGKNTDVIDAPHCFLWLHSGGNVYHGLSDVRSSQLASAASGNTLTLASTLRVGGNYATVFTQIDIAEIVVYAAAVSESDRLGVEKYIANKYGLSLGGGPALTLSLVLPSGGAASRVSHLYHVQLETGSFPTSRIVSQGGVAQGRDKSEHTIEVTTDAKVYDPSLGAWFCEFVPGWSSADLGSTEDRYIFWQETNGGADHDALFYDASAGAWVFERKVGASTYTASKTASVTRGTAVKLAARWTGAEGELDLAAYTISVFVDGVKGTDATSAAPTFTSPETLHRGHDGAKANHANGAIREVRVFPYALVDEEIAALP